MRNVNVKVGWCLASLGVCLVACARDSVSLGDDPPEAPLVPSERCAAEPVIDADVRVTNQAELDALAGCEEISGELAIEVFAGADLRPLASLRAVGGRLIIGDRSSILDQESWLSLADAGWLASFEGVEALERVGSLALASFDASDLSRFSSLRYINAANQDGRVLAGLLDIEYAKNLVDLRGFERVGGIDRLTIIDAPALESLDGLTVGYRFETILLENAPSLKNIDALAPLERGTSLAIVETGLEDLGSLSSLVSVQQFNVMNNASLVEASSFPSPVTAAFAVVGNPKLRGTLEVRELVSPDIGIIDNDELERISLNEREQHTIPWTGGRISIEGNANLRSITSPNGCDQLESLDVLANPSLETLELGRLSRLDELHIRDNAELFTLSHAEFERIYVVDVVNNPLLSASSLASVPAFERTLQGNAD
jgi:hypothetical protein